VAEQPAAGLGSTLVAANPVADNATIRFSLAQAGLVSCLVYDAAGNRVAELADGRMAAGEHRFTWNAGAVPAGIYLCQLATDAGSHTVRLVKAH